MNIWTMIGVVLTAVAVIIAAMQWMLSNAFKKGEHYKKIDDAHEWIKAHDRKSIDCEKRFVQIEERKTDSKSIDDIRTDITLIKRSLNALVPERSVGGLLQSYSPISLSPLGVELAEKMNIDSRISNNWSKIYDFLEDRIQSKNAYDIQQFCIETASVFPEKFLSDEDVEFLKNYAYNEGRPLVYYGGMIGVMIRDKYFEVKGIDVSEVDKYTPKAQ